MMTFRGNLLSLEGCVFGIRWHLQESPLECPQPQHSAGSVSPAQRYGFNVLGVPFSKFCFSQAGFLPGLHGRPAWEMRR